MTMDPAAQRAAAVYDAAADHFDDPALGFWDRFGQATVDRIPLSAGARVLDVCAGAGASALPAARRVGPEGAVVAVDVAANLLALAGEKARREGLTNLTLRHQELAALDEPEGGFDAVVIVFGIFFMPDMGSAARRLWSLVRPGGTLAVTTWGPDVFEPANSVFWAAVEAVRPDLHRGYNPWDQLTDPAALRALLEGAGCHDVAVEAVQGTHVVEQPVDFWTVVLGSGYRATIDAMTPAERAALRRRVVGELEATGVRELVTNVVYATARR